MSTPLTFKDSLSGPVTEYEGGTQQVTLSVLLGTVVIVNALDKRTGLTAADGSPVLSFVVPTSGPWAYDVECYIDCVRYTSGAATYAVTYVKPDGVAATITVSVGGLDVDQAVSKFVMASGSSTITGQLLGTFSATIDVCANVRKVG